ncbi:hypothetical protein [Sorangium sp. So ce861]|uniref:hypothetical protein n=1 Tax=Sorangium sp. So ce861 TaxID=3133323 RepID=UPI003F5F27A0
MKRLWWMALPLLLSSGLVLWWLSSRSPADSADKRRAEAEQGHVEDDLMQRVAALEAENTRMRREVSLTRSAVQSTLAEGRPEEPAHSGEAEQETSQRPAEAGLRSRQRAAMAAYEEELRSRLDGEAPDRSWTASVENGVRATLGTLEDAPVLESVRCGGSLCAVVVSHEQARAHMDLLTAVKKANPPGFGGQVLMRRHPGPDGGYQTTLFLSRTGESFPGLNEALSAR